MEVNANGLYAGLICLVLGGFAFATYYFLERRRIGAHEQRQRRRFEAEPYAAPRASWDGDQYDWTPEAMAYLNDPYANRVPSPTMPQPALILPPAHPSSPQRVQQPPRYAAAPGSQLALTAARRRTGPQPAAPWEDPFLAKLRAENAKFLAQWPLQ
jgi:hypothetical protein